MNNMRNRIMDVNEKLSGKFAEKLMDVAETIGQQARGRCIGVFFYETKIPIELLEQEE